MKNFWIRSLSGICFLGIVFGALLINKWFFAGFELFILVVMMREFYKMTLGKHFPYSRFFAMLTGVSLFCLIFLVASWPGRYSIKLVAVALVPMLAVMGGSLYTKEKKAFGLFSNLYTGLLYLAIPVSLSNLIVFNNAGVFNGNLMLSFFIIIWGGDVGAYTFGMLFGRNGKKLFPSVSPKKSWAGFWGGLFIAMVFGGILHLFPAMLPYSLVHCVVLALLMNIAGVYGDLFESQWKRVCGVKDSGAIIPGHGGLLDRFDSAIFAMPVGAIYLILAGLL